MNSSSATREHCKMFQCFKVMPLPNTTKNAAQAASGEVSMATRQRTDFTEWVQENIKRRHCNTFVAVTKKGDETTCCCGYKKEKHSQNVTTGKGSDGKVKHNTTKHTTDAYGEVEFGYGQRISKFIRVDHSTPMDQMMELLTEHWRLKKPNLLISVTGGAKDFTMHQRLKEVFRRGLMKAAGSTGAWILTGGMNEGVMKLVGEAIRDYKVDHGTKNPIIALGISPWGCVNGKEALIEHEEKGLWPAYCKPKYSQSKESSLDPNHSHFILVDNGTQQQFGTEIKFRARLERHISNNLNTTTTAGESNVSIPIVCVVLGGGLGTLNTVRKATKSDTPAIIFEGSGRAADILAYAYANSFERKDVDESGNIEFTSDFDDKIKEKIKDEWKTETNIGSVIKLLKKCMKKRNSMTVVHLDGGNSAKDIDLAIRRALLKEKGKRVDPLKWVFAWNRIDIAKNVLFTDEYKSEDCDLDDLMFKAIRNDCKDFVELFLENGVSLKQFLTVGRLLELYNNLPDNNLLNQLLKKKQGSTEAKYSLADVGRVIRYLTGDSYNPLYLRRPYKYLTFTDKTESDKLLLDAVLSDKKTSQDGPKCNPACHTVDQQKTKVTFEEPARELFVWSVLNHRLEMAVFFWKEGKERIAAALTVQKIMRRHTTEDSELEKELLVQEEYYGKLALGVLSECYAADEQGARHVLVQELRLFGESTCVQLAVEADNKKFLAHAACQSLLNNIWRGQISHDTGLARIWVCVVLPFLIIPLITFSPLSLFSLESGNTTQLSSSASETSDDYVRSQLGPTSHRDCSDPKLKKIVHFFNAPSVTFYYNCISYICFLLLYSYVLLVEFATDIMFPNKQITFSPWEILLIIWIASLLVEEIRQVVMTEAITVRLKFRTYLGDKWSILDMISLTTFMVGIMLRVLPLETCNNQSCFVAARVIYGLNLMTFFFRVLHMFSVHKQLGPKLVMIGLMMVDLMFFLVILLLFVSSYGIATQAIMYPGTAPSIALVRDILKRPYFQMFGELFLEEIEGSSCPDSGCSHPTSQWLVPIMLGVYILITNILMINLVIAMFSYTFSKIQDRADEHWKYQCYFLVKEYYGRSPLAPPLILLSHIYFIVRSMCLRRWKCSIKDDNVFKRQFNEIEIRELILWENMHADEYLRDSRADKSTSQEHWMQSIDARMESIAQQVSEMQTGNQQQSEKIGTPLKFSSDSIENHHGSKIIRMGVKFTAYI